MTSNSLVTLITCTGARHKAFALCESYVKRQTYKGPLQWIVVDDYQKEPTKCTMGQEYVPGPLQWKDGINTQRPNMDVGLARAKGDFIFVFEDDDWYAPTYIETMLWLLEKYPVVGEGNNKYYNIKTQSFKEWNNFKHASLCSTALRKSHQELLYKAIHSGELFMDINFWLRCRHQNVPAVIFMNVNLGVGMKGLPGRHGIGAGHDPATQGFSPDKDWQQLESWIGKTDTQVYKELK